MRQGINSLADCGMNLCSRSRLNLKTYSVFQVYEVGTRQCRVPTAG
ncbi:hypothetical protein QUB30_02435 [Microcoleus sp. BROC3]